MLLCTLLVSLRLALACNESKLVGAGRQPETDKAGGGEAGETDAAGHTDGLPVGREVVARVGKLFDFSLDLRAATLPSGVGRVQLHVVDASGRDLPEAIMRWRDPEIAHPAWSQTVGTRVVVEFEEERQAAQFEDIFLRTDLPKGAQLVVTAITANEEQEVRKHPLRSEAGKYDMRVVYAEPGIRGHPVIEFNFAPGIPTRQKGRWYVAERAGESNVGGYGVTGSSFSHLPIPTVKLVVRPSDDHFDTDNECYVALVNIDNNVKADHFGECLLSTVSR